MSVHLHRAQSLMFNALFKERSVRFAVGCCARGFGKSFLGAAAAVTAVGECESMPASVPNKRVTLIAPTYDQVVDIYYPLLAYTFRLKQFAVKESRADGMFLFNNGTSLNLISYEAVERERGKGNYFIGWDEVSSCRKGLHPQEAWESILEPTIRTRWSPMQAKRFGAPSPGRALVLSTPKGYNYFHTLYNNQELDDDWKSWQFDYLQSPQLDPKDIEKAKSRLDPIRFASEYLALFKESGNSVFYCFDRSIHVREDIESPHSHEDIHVNIDFNVGLQCSSVFVIRGGQMHFVDEFKGHPDTEQLANCIVNKYAGHKIFAYPDPTGKSRKTSAPVGRTDFSILRSKGIIVLARKGSPGIVDSVNAVNRMLKTASGETNMFFHPRCKGTIESVERTVWAENNPDLAVISKKEGVEHFSDGIRYGTEYLFPIRGGGNYSMESTFF